ncbi:MAG TPA: glycoside hydrolase family 27 protein [Acidobacteriaceae bacterium]|jgi:alpha-galactosidase
MLKELSFATLAMILLSTQVGAQSKPVLSITPPMGWNSWNKFAEHVTDDDIRKTADLLVSTGLRDAGYIYVNIDDTWEGKRDAQGNIQGNEKFPNMKALSDYVHSKGLKLGIYSSPGPKTCANYEGSYGHEEQDANTYAAWGIDYLKYDVCSFREIMEKQGGANLNKQYVIERAAYEKMHKALAATGRPIVYSICQYGSYRVWEWAAEVGANLWRTTYDIHPNYERVAMLGFGQSGLARYAGPGHWNDPDMLEIGNGMLPEADRSHMSLWALLAAPLLAGNDLTAMTPETLATLSNKEVIAVDQDSLGEEGDRLSAEGPIEIWIRNLSGGRKAIGLFNLSAGPLNVKLPLKKLGWQTAEARDLWQHKDLGAVHDGEGFPINERGVVMLVLKRP